MNRKERRTTQSQDKQGDAIDHNNRGNLLQQQGRFEDALQCYRQALSLKPDYVSAWNNQAVALQALKRYDEALASYDKAIAFDPGYAQAHGNRADLLGQMQRYGEALDGYGRAIVLKPDYWPAHHNRGLTFKVLKRYGEALAAFDDVIAANPDFAQAHNNRAVILQELKRYDEALASADRALRLAPLYVEALSNRGLALQKMKRHGEALAVFDAALVLKPDAPQLYNNRGITLQEMHHCREALAHYDKAIALKPDYVDALYNRGNALHSLRRYAEALAQYDRAIAITPDYARAYNNRGLTLRELRRYEEALESLQKAMALAPVAPYLAGTLLHTKMLLADWQDTDVLHRRLMDGLQHGHLVSTPFPALGLLSSAKDQQHCAQLHIAHQFPPAAGILWRGERYQHAKIRIAFVSDDFREHPMSFLMAGLFEQLDRTRFDIYAISLRPEDNSATGKRVRAAFEHFIDVSALSDYEVAKCLREQEIDIAVDLMGFTKNSRTAVFAHRPSPVQLHYLGYPGTMGASYMDYIIADRFVIPPAVRPYYTERIVTMPDCFQVNDDKRFFPDRVRPRTSCGLPETGFVFCAFNNTYKITPAVFDIWMRLLACVEGSVLWLLGEGSAQRHFREEATRRGIDPTRLVFASRVSYEEHLARLPNADLYLDTLPFNAGATASDVLWAGVPLLTCAGDAFSSRMAGSLLVAIGLPELIAGSMEAYERLACELAADKDTLSALRRRLASNRETSPLFNTERFTRHFEAACIAMWERTQAGLPPDDISVAAG